MICLRLPEETDERLDHLVKETKRSKSYYVREAIDEFLKKHEKHLLRSSVAEKKNRLKAVNKKASEMFF